MTDTNPTPLEHLENVVYEALQNIYWAANIEDPKHRETALKEALHLHGPLLEWLTERVAGGTRYQDVDQGAGLVQVTRRRGWESRTRVKTTFLRTSRSARTCQSASR